MATAKESTKCTKPECDDDRSGDKPWCKKHLAEYQRDYVKTKEGMAEGKGFAEGARLMREQLATQFESQRSGMFTGYEICDLIREALPPARVD